MTSLFSIPLLIASITPLGTYAQQSQLTQSLGLQSQQATSNAAQPQQPSPALMQPTPAQVQACLANLPAPPMPPAPPSKPLFPGVQKRIDDGIRKLGGDPDAMRAEAAKAEVARYNQRLQALAQQRSGCYAPTVALPAVLIPSGPAILPDHPQQTTPKQ